MAASDAQLEVEVATPNGLVLHTAASSVQTPSVEGEFGVLPGHLPVLAALKCGVMTYMVDGKKQYAAIGPGFVKAGPAKVEILTDLYLEPAKIDVDAARNELSEAEEKLKAFGERYEGPDYNELQRDVDWAQARLDAFAEADAV